MAIVQRKIQVTDDLEALLVVLPPHIRDALHRQGGLDDLLEVVLDLGRQPEARFPGRAVTLSDDYVAQEDLNYVVSRVGIFGRDNRAGIERTLHRISAIRNRQGDVIGLTCRVGRAVFGTVDIVRDLLESGKSILLLGRPGVGKTTLLREAARVLADELAKRVVVVDTSNEIAGDGDIPHPGIGRARRMQVPSPELQHAVMIEAVENHMPEVIVIDEIGTEAEAMAARTIAERGVQLIATAHGNTLDNLLVNPTLSDLIGGIQPVTLSDEEAKRRGTQKTVLERKAPPTFDILIEIQDKDRLVVHRDIAKVVDRFLRGSMPRPEIRVRREDGAFEVTEIPSPELYRPEEPAGEAPERRPKAAWERTAALRRPGKPLRIYPYAVSRNRLERAIKDLQVPALVTENLREADLVLTLKSQERRGSKKFKEAIDAGIEVRVIRSNTAAQIKAFLREAFELSDEFDREEQALREAEEAVSDVLSKRHPVELEPQSAYIRRLQHQLIQRYGLFSESKGEEPYRRVVIYPR